MIIPAIIYYFYNLSLLTFMCIWNKDTEVSLQLGCLETYKAIFITIIVISNLPPDQSIYYAITANTHVCVCVIVVNVSLLQYFSFMQY